MPADSARVDFDHVSRVFHTPSRGRVAALHDVCLACAPGALTCVLGPSGCGKTTLLRLVAGLDRPSGGSVRVDGADVQGPPAGIAHVSQEGDLLPWRRAWENVALAMELRRVPRAERKRRAAEAMERVHLPAGLARSRLHELSGGMRQRVALARALTIEPRLLLMDEPFARLDEPTRHRLQQQFIELTREAPRTVLFVTHSLAEAVFLADRVVVLADGRVVHDEPIDLPHPRDRLSEPFVHQLQELRRVLAAAVVAGDEPPPSGRDDG